MVTSSMTNFVWESAGGGREGGTAGYKIRRITATVVIQSLEKLYLFVGDNI